MLAIGGWGSNTGDIVLEIVSMSATVIWYCSANRTVIYTVSQKNSQNCFWYNTVKFSPTLIIFGTKKAKTIELCMVHSFTTSPNFCQCTSVWNTYAPNCYITQRLFVSSDVSPFHHEFDRGCNVV